MQEIDQAAFAKFLHQAGLMRFLVSHAGYNHVKLPIARHWRDITNADPDKLFSDLITMGLFREAALEERLMASLQKPELQSILRDAGKPVSGTKKVLVQRILGEAKEAGSRALPDEKVYVPSDWLKEKLPELQRTMDNVDQMERLTTVKSNYRRVVQSLKQNRGFYIGLNFQAGNNPCSHAEQFIGYYPTDRLPIFPPPQCTGARGCTCYWEVVDRDELREMKQCNSSFISLQEKQPATSTESEEASAFEPENIRAYKPTAPSTYEFLKSEPGWDESPAARWIFCIFGIPAIVILLVTMFS